MEIPENIGWRRILLSRTQKFILDMQRLGSDNKPNRVEKLIIFLEGLAPDTLALRLKRHGTRAIINIYWYTMPKRLKVSKSHNPQIHAYLPWFRGKNKKIDQHLYQFGKGGKILTASSGRGDKDIYTYSWKKAYYMAQDMKKQVQQEEQQRKLDYELKKLKGDPTPWK